MIWDEMSPLTELWFSYVIDQWKQVGINVKAKVLGAEYSKVFAETHEWDLEPTAFAWGVNVLDANNWFDIETSRYKNQEGLALIQQAATQEGDEFNKTIWKMQDLAAEELPIAYQVIRSQPWGISNKSPHGENFKPIYALWTRNDWGLQDVTVDP